MVKKTIRKFVAYTSMALLASSVAVGSVMAAAKVPQFGKYVAEGGNYSIEITSTNSSIGQITAEYNASYSPAGPLSVKGDIGQYSWVKYNVAPFGIRFGMKVRPSGWPYIIFDNWTGAYQVDNTLLLSGVRSYVNSDGVIEVRTLGTKTFSK
ncbi:MAG: hypothetical protein DRR16_21080 [Candidatus Parabeggiatoa sp. nov. 3]|nr:MAG: hypothetical protein DRR00_06725 [Gammaproteobacteria bacterium]RKZ54987.1 MAG: hypothetical protein DRQ99_30605 [Gammaproteobacteria bacterium]RKZ81867.1 MAG: hypothetical protein DRR16_21080 [Gammaproteobacteria bacterium]HEW97148.1 hypothetical protein [Beggiatoa sp.]